MSMGSKAIVVGTDGTPSSDVAVRWAAREAVRQGTLLRILHAFSDDLQETSCDIGCGHVSLEQQLAAAVLAGAQEQARIAAPGVRSEVLAVAGRAAPALLLTARRAGLLVVGSHGRGGLAELVLRSVSRRITEVAQCHVVVVRGRADSSQGPVVVGVDETPGVDEILAVAFHAAASRNATLIAIRAYPPPAPLWVGDVVVTGLGDPGLEAPTQDAEEHALLEKQLRVWRRLYPRVHAEAAISHDDAAVVLTQLSRRAQLIVTGSSMHGTLAGILLGSKSLHLTHHAHCPVLIVRHYQAAA
jgi:nucleotide-binding universal stress UspA family protein